MSMPHHEPSDWASLQTMLFLFLLLRSVVSEVDRGPGASKTRKSLRGLPLAFVYGHERRDRTWKVTYVLDALKTVQIRCDDKADLLPTSSIDPNPPCPM
jgi:hypothetical protein